MESIEEEILIILRRQYPDSYEELHQQTLKLILDVIEDEDFTLSCPRCDSTNIHHFEDNDTLVKCNTCSHEFET